MECTISTRCKLKSYDVALYIYIGLYYEWDLNVMLLYSIEYSALSDICAFYYDFYSKCMIIFM